MHSLAQPATLRWSRAAVSVLALTSLAAPIGLDAASASRSATSDDLGGTRAGVGGEAPQSAASGPTRSTRDGVYSSREAARGRALYDRVCAYCHAEAEFGPDYMIDWDGQPIGALYDFIRMTMPEDNPGDLSRRQYADVVAYLLRINGAPAGEHDLGHDAGQLDEVLIEGPFEESGNPR